MENKQTAVEWFNQQLVDRQCGNGDSRSWDEILEQAKQMDKEQKIDAYIEGRGFTQYTYDQLYDNIEYWEREPLGFEDYYNETYGN